MPNQKNWFAVLLLCGNLAACGSGQSSTAIDASKADASIDAASTRSPYGDCLTTDSIVGPACDSTATECLGGPHGQSGVCAKSCNSVNDCAPAPTGFNAKCADLGGVDADKECFIACPLGSCPDGMVCIGNTVCHWGKPWTTAAYGNCLEGSQCTGDCIVDATTPTWGSCAANCDASACPAAPGGFPTACADVGLGTKSCYMDCSTMACPTGMTCADLTDTPSVLRGCVWKI